MRRQLNLLQVFAKFTKVGLQAWGDSAARLTALYREFVDREKWIDTRTFARAYGVYQALPGPEALEMAVHIGTRRYGRTGGFLAGIGFVLPGVLLTLLLAHLYGTFGRETWGVAGVLYALRPAVIALIAYAILRLAQGSIRNEYLMLVAMGSFTAALVTPLSFALVLFLFAGTYFVAMRPRASGPAPAMALTSLYLGASGLPLLLLLGLFFLEAGLLTFGGSYTVLPFLAEGAVEEFGWVTEEQFLDAVALCAMVPASLVVVAAFVGYLVAGPLGGLVSAAGILFPAFAFTLVKPQAIIALVESPHGRDFFEGVTSAVVGLVGATILRLSHTAFVDPMAILIGIVAYFFLQVRRTNAFFVVFGSACFGVILEASGYL